MGPQVWLFPRFANDSDICLLPASLVHGVKGFLFGFDLQNGGFPAYAPTSTIVANVGDVLVTVFAIGFRDASDFKFGHIVSSCRRSGGEVIFLCALL